MRVEVTSAAVDRLMGKPLDLVNRGVVGSLRNAREQLEAAGAIIEGDQGVRFPPWRQAYCLDLQGSGSPDLLLYSKPVELAIMSDSEGSELDAADYSIGSDRRGLRDRALRDSGWSKRMSVSGLSRTPDPNSEIDAWKAEVTSGWLMPGQVGTWSAAANYKAELATTSRDDPETGAAYERGSWVRSSDPRIVLRFECTTAGIAGATEPAEFATALPGDTIVDAAATWTARSAQELPADLERAALSLAVWLYETRGANLGCNDDATASKGLSSTIPESLVDTFRAYRT